MSAMGVLSGLVLLTLSFVGRDPMYGPAVLQLGIHPPRPHY